MGYLVKYELIIYFNIMKVDIEQFINWRINNTDIRDLNADEKIRDILINGF
jgi:hypothetical protein